VARDDVGWRSLRCACSMRSEAQGVEACKTKAVGGCGVTALMDASSSVPISALKYPGIVMSSERLLSLTRSVSSRSKKGVAFAPSLCGT